MLLTADVVATAALKTTDHDVIKRMGCRVEMFGYGKTRRVVSNTAEVLTTEVLTKQFFINFTSFKNFPSSIF